MDGLFNNHLMRIVLGFSIFIARDNVFPSPIITSRFSQHLPIANLINNNITLSSSTMNCHPKPRNSPTLPKEQNASTDQPRQKHKCPTCQELGLLLCYACCYQIACEHCFTEQHYGQCKRKFNHHTVNLVDLAMEDHHKRQHKKRQNQRCQRCMDTGQKCEYCTKCKINLCGKCAQETHSIGKFTQHTFVKIQSSPNKYKKLETFLTETDEAEENVMKKSTKDNLQKRDFGQRPKERINKINSTPVQNKKGKSAVKPNNKNQENVVSTVGREKNQASKDFDASQVSNIVHFAPPRWQTCPNHHKLRTIFTDNSDLICPECYQSDKLSISKTKNIDVMNWLREGVNSEEIKLNFAASLNQFSIKMKQLESQFSSYRQSLSDEFTKKQEMLAERYRSNLSTLDKWENLYKASINHIIKTCSDNLDIRSYLLQNQSHSHKEKARHELTKFINFKNFLALEEVNQCKKEFYLQEEQYQFRVSEINCEYFQDMMKNFSFARRRIDNQQLNSNQKSVSKMQNSNYLRQSRLSNSSLVTDRKTLKRDDSFQRSNYCELSNSSNLVKRSMSKEIKKDELPKDISQRILFPNEDPSEKKNTSSQNMKKLEKQMKNSQHFFENMQGENDKIKGKQKKEPLELSSYCFKDVKYVNLENFLTEKLEKIYDEKKEPGRASEKGNIFSNDLEISTEIVDLQTQQPKSSMVSDSRLTYSTHIDSLNPSFNKLPCDSNPNSNSLHASNKNKRKSDYMEMRDRLRKPNIMHKITK